MSISSPRMEPSSRSGKVVLPAIGPEQAAMPNAAPVANARSERRRLPRVSLVVMRELLFGKTCRDPRQPWGPNIPVEGKHKKLSVEARCTTTRNFFYAENPCFLSVYSTLRLRTVLLGSDRLAIESRPLPTAQVARPQLFGSAFRWDRHARGANRSRGAITSRLARRTSASDDRCSSTSHEIYRWRRYGSSLATKSSSARAPASHSFMDARPFNVSM